MLKLVHLSNRSFLRSILSETRRCLTSGAVEPKTHQENLQSTVNIIKEDLRLIHGDIIRVS